jgi:GR25 family glycosyltransferase involved in LPS biosynthesis
MFKSYIITLDGHEWSEELANDAIESAKSHGWDIEKFSAVDGRKTNLQTELNTYNLRLYAIDNKPGIAMRRPGVYGNFISHYKLWNICLSSGSPIGCFEHDVIFHDSPSLVNMDFAHLLKLDKLKIQKNYGTGVCYMGAHAYILKPEGAERLIKWSKENGVLPADVMMGEDVINIGFDENQLITFNPKQEQDINGYTVHSTSKTMSF